MLRVLILMASLAAASYALPAELLPYKAFPDEAQAKKVKAVVDHRTFRHSIADTRFQSDSRTFNYLLDRMPMTTAIMREMGLEKYEITSCPDGTMKCDDKEGVIGTMETAYTANDKRVYYGDGTFDAPLLGKIRGESVVVLDYVQQEPGVMANTVTIFIRVHSFFAPIMKLFSPAIKGMVTRKSASLMGASMKLSEKLTCDPEAVYDKIQDSEIITPGELSDFKKAFLPDEGASSI